jgi:hypothetical protein
MALYWHPFLADLLRFDYGDRLIVEEEVPLGEMPLRADLLLIRRDLTLWLIASHFRAQVSRVGAAHLAGQQEVGAGVTGGTLDGFPTFFIDLQRLPFQPEALPLLMVAKGPREREVVEFLVEHFRQYPRYVRLLRELHVQALREVLVMKQLTPEQIGIEYQTLLDLIGEERVIDLLGEERVIDLLGRERILELFGEERLAEALIRRKGGQWLRALIERYTQQSDVPEAPQTPPPPES